MLEILATVVFVASVVSAFSPPVEWFDKWPKVKKYYGGAIWVIDKVAALNFRGAVARKYVERRDRKAALRALREGQ